MDDHDLPPPPPKRLPGQCFHMNIALLGDSGVGKSLLADRWGAVDNFDRLLRGARSNTGDAVYCYNHELATTTEPAHHYMLSSPHNSSGNLLETAANRPNSSGGADAESSTQHPTTIGVKHISSAPPSQGVSPRSKMLAKPPLAAVSNLNLTSFNAAPTTNPFAVNYRKGSIFANSLGTDALQKSGSPTAPRAGRLSVGSGSSNSYTNQIPPLSTTTQQQQQQILLNKIIRKDYISNEMIRVSAKEAEIILEAVPEEGRIYKATKSLEMKRVHVNVRGCIDAALHRVFLLDTPGDEDRMSIVGGLFEKKTLKEGLNGVVIICDPSIDERFPQHSEKRAKRQVSRRSSNVEKNNNNADSEAESEGNVFTAFTSRKAAKPHHGATAAAAKNDAVSLLDDFERRNSKRPDGKPNSRRSSYLSHATNANESEDEGGPLDMQLSPDTPTLSSFADAVASHSRSRRGTGMFADGDADDFALDGGTNPVGGVFGAANGNSHHHGGDMTSRTNETTTTSDNNSVMIPHASGSPTVAPSRNPLVTARGGATAWSTTSTSNDAQSKSPLLHVTSDDTSSSQQQPRSLSLTSPLIVGMRGGITAGLPPRQVPPNLDYIYERDETGSPINSFPRMWGQHAATPEAAAAAATETGSGGARGPRGPHGDWSRLTGGNSNGSPSSRRQQNTARWGFDGDADDDTTSGDAGADARRRFSQQNDDMHEDSAYVRPPRQTFDALYFHDPDEDAFGGISPEEAAKLTANAIPPYLHRAMAMLHLCVRNEVPAVIFHVGDPPSVAAYEYVLHRYDSVIFRAVTLKSKKEMRTDEDVQKAFLLQARSLVDFVQYVHNFKIESEHQLEEEYQRRVKEAERLRLRSYSKRLDEVVPRPLDFKYHTDVTVYDSLSTNADHSLKVRLLGAPASGKTSFLLALLDDHRVTTHQPTNELDVATCIVELKGRDGLKRLLRQKAGLPPTKKDLANAERAAQLSGNGKKRRKSQQQQRRIENADAEAMAETPQFASGKYNLSNNSRLKKNSLLPAGPRDSFLAFDGENTTNLPVVKPSSPAPEWKGILKTNNNGETFSPTAARKASMFATNLSDVSSSANGAGNARSAVHAHSNSPMRRVTLQGFIPSRGEGGNASPSANNTNYKKQPTNFDRSSPARTIGSTTLGAFGLSASVGGGSPSGARMNASVHHRGGGGPNGGLNTTPSQQPLTNTAKSATESTIDKDIFSGAPFYNRSTKLVLEQEALQAGTRSNQSGAKLTFLGSASGVGSGSGSGSGANSGVLGFNLQTVEQATLDIISATSKGCRAAPIGLEEGDILSDALIGANMNTKAVLGAANAKGKATMQELRAKVRQFVDGPNAHAAGQTDHIDAGSTTWQATTADLLIKQQRELRKAEEAERRQRQREDELEKKSDATQYGVEVTGEGAFEESLKDMPRFAGFNNNASFGGGGTTANASMDKYPASGSGMIRSASSVFGSSRNGANGIGRSREGLLLASSMNGSTLGAGESRTTIPFGASTTTAAAAAAKRKDSSATATVAGILRNRNSLFGAGASPIKRLRQQLIFQHSSGSGLGGGGSGTFHVRETSSPCQADMERQPSSLGSYMRKKASQAQVQNGVFVGMKSKFIDEDADSVSSRDDVDGDDTNEGDSFGDLFNNGSDDDDDMDDTFGGRMYDDDEIHSVLGGVQTDTTQLLGTERLRRAKASAELGERGELENRDTVVKVTFFDGQKGANITNSTNNANSLSPAASGSLCANDRVNSMLNGTLSELENTRNSALTSQLSGFSNYQQNFNKKTANAPQTQKSIASIRDAKLGNLPPFNIVILFIDATKGKEGLKEASQSIAEEPTASHILCILTKSEGTQAFTESKIPSKELRKPKKFHPFSIGHSLSTRHGRPSADFDADGQQLMLSPPPSNCFADPRGELTYDEFDDFAGKLNAYSAVVDARDCHRGLIAKFITAVINEEAKMKGRIQRRAFTELEPSRQMALSDSLFNALQAMPYDGEPSTITNAEVAVSPSRNASGGTKRAVPNTIPFSNLPPPKQHQIAGNGNENRLLLLAARTQSPTNLNTPSLSSSALKRAASESNQTARPSVIGMVIADANNNKLKPYVYGAGSSFNTADAQTPNTAAATEEKNRRQSMVTFDTRALVSRREGGEDSPQQQRLLQTRASLAGSVNSNVFESSFGAESVGGDTVRLVAASGGLSYQPPPSEFALRDLFNEIDEDADGFISGAEMRALYDAFDRAHLGSFKTSVVSVLERGGRKEEAELLLAANASELETRLARQHEILYGGGSGANSAGESTSVPSPSLAGAAHQSSFSFLDNSKMNNASRFLSLRGGGVSTKGGMAGGSSGLHPPPPQGEISLKAMLEPLNVMLNNSMLMSFSAERTDFFSGAGHGQQGVSNFSIFVDGAESEEESELDVSMSKKKPKTVVAENPPTSPSTTVSAPQKSSLLTKKTPSFRISHLGGGTSIALHPTHHVNDTIVLPPIKSTILTAADEKRRKESALKAEIDTGFESEFEKMLNQNCPSKSGAGKPMSPTSPDRNAGSTRGRISTPSRSHVRVVSHLAAFGGGGKKSSTSSKLCSSVLSSTGEALGDDGLLAMAAGSPAKKRDDQWLSVLSKIRLSFDEFTAIMMTIAKL